MNSSPINKKYKSLSRHVIIQFCLFAVALSLVFSFYNFIFLYTLEDTFIERSIENEAEYIQQEFLSTSQWPVPRKSYITLHHETSSFPQEVKEIFDKEPNRREFSGLEGRHYHLVKINTKPEKYLIAEVSEQLVVRPIRSGLLILLFFTMLVLTSVACYLGYRLSKKSIRPLTDLVTLVDGVSPNNLPKNFAEKFPNNEIGVLAQTIDLSMQRINEFVEREQHFTRDASHELRTPIAIVKNAAELLEAKDNLSENDKELIARIRRANLHMEQSVNALLSLAREESNNNNTEPVKIRSEVEKSIIEHAHLIENKVVDVEVDIDEKSQVWISLGVLQILLSNLISNAFQYTESGRVTITFENRLLTVFDTGPGIDESIEETLLDPLVKGEKSQGFGLGLSIVKRLCDHHQLKLTVDSKTEGMLVSIKFHAPADL